MFLAYTQPINASKNKGTHSTPCKVYIKPRPHVSNQAMLNSMACSSLPLWAKTLLWTWPLGALSAKKVVFPLYVNLLSSEICSLLRLAAYSCFFFPFFFQCGEGWILLRKVLGYGSDDRKWRHPLQSRMIPCVFGHESHLNIISLMHYLWNGKEKEHTSDILRFECRTCTGCKPSTMANEATTLLLIITHVNAQISSARLYGTRRLGLTGLMSYSRSRFWGWS